MRKIDVADLRVFERTMTGRVAAERATLASGGQEYARARDWQRLGHR